MRTLGYNKECLKITNFELFKKCSNISRTLGYFKEFSKIRHEFSIILKTLHFDGF